MANDIPAYFGHYQVIRELGSGGFASAYLTYDTKLERYVVLKVLHNNFTFHGDVFKRFKLEAKALAQLDHSNIVRVHAVEDDPRQPYIVMEFVPGRTLGDYLPQRPLSAEKALPILRQIAAALDVAHAQRMVHRDVKPSNILITQQGHVKLTDFGIVKMMQGTTTKLTRTNMTLGTPLYMAPEQVDTTRQHEIGPATDIYALGVVAYQMLAGQVPFKGARIEVIMAAHSTTPPPDPRTFNPNISASVVKVLMKVLEKKPSDRYPTASAFVNALEQASRSTPPSNTLLVSKLGFSQKVLLIMLGLVALLLVAIIVGGVGQILLTGGEELETPVPSITRSITTRVAPKDGMVQVYVPEGEFLMGSDSEADSPSHTVQLGAFWMDQTEVTNEMYAACVEAGDCTAPALNRTDPMSSYYDNNEYKDYPVIYVSWKNAERYCKWAGRQLPTEAQWEKAARGTDGRIYPWGNPKPDQKLLNFANEVQTISPVKSYPEGASPYGAYDMAGNVFEWVADWYDGNYYNSSPEDNPAGPTSGEGRVIRGGAWNRDANHVQATFRFWKSPSTFENNIGFRCAD